MSINTFRELLIQELQELNDAENQIIRGLPQLEKIISNQDFKQFLKKILLDTKEQSSRLKKALQLLDANEGREQCRALTSMMSDVEENIKKFKLPLLKEAAIIGAIQKIKHFSIASYGTALAHAKLLKLDEIEDLLNQTLEEKAAADKKLTKIAEGSFFKEGINEEALHKAHR